MQQKITLFLVACATIIAGGIFAGTLSHAMLSSSEEETTVVPENVIKEDIALVTTSESPDRLIIPSIHVDAHVQSVGVAKNGNMAVPTNYTDVGWYRKGPLPGETGSAVIDGHVNNGFNLDAVFANLSTLEEGADIYVVDKS